MPISENDPVFENMLRSSREQFAKTSAYAIYKELERMKRDGATLDNRFDWLETKLSNVLEQYAAILDDLAARYASLRVDKAEATPSGPFKKSECPKQSVASTLEFGTIDDVHATLHHWNKYHNPTASGFMGGEFYLGEECVNCPFSDAQKAIREMETKEAVADFCGEKMNAAVKELNERVKWHERMTDADTETIDLLMPKFVAADWMPEGEIMLVNPGIKCRVETPDGTVKEYWEKNPSAVLVKNVGVSDGHSK